MRVEDSNDISTSSSIDSSSVNTDNVDNVTTKTKKNKARPLMKREPLTVQELLNAPKSPIFEVRLKQAEILRLAGNDAFKEKKMPEALLLYERALFHCNFEDATMKFEFTDTHKVAVYNAKDPLHLNCARAAMKIGAWRDSLVHLNSILNRDKEDTCKDEITLRKAFFLGGKVYMKLNEWDHAKNYFAKATCLIETGSIALSSKLDEDGLIEKDGDAINNQLKQLSEDSAIIEQLVRECSHAQVADRKKEAEVWRGKMSTPNHKQQQQSLSKNENDDEDDEDDDEKEMTDTLPILQIRTIAEALFANRSRTSKYLVTILVAVVSISIVFGIRYFSD